MPTISQFFGVSIRMYFDDHEPPHFHVYYAEYAAAIDLETLRVIRGRVPRRTLSTVLEWALRHRDELRENWRRVCAHEQPAPIAPLE
ncbi:MAG: DUF4160 domain-containing protein [Gemmatimonadota bacterium]